MSNYRELVPIAPPPPPPRATSWMFPLALVIDGVDVLATRSRRAYVLRGALGVVLLPILFALLVVLLGFGLGVDDEILIAPWVGLSILSVGWGIALIALSRTLSMRRAVRFDRARGVVAQGAQQLPFVGLELRVRKLEGISGWTAVEACHDARVITIHDRLPAMHLSDVIAQVNYLAELVGAPPHPPPAPTAQRLIPDHTAAMLCYLPFQGINVIASLYYLFAARDRPFVRFAAKQSLTQMVTTVFALFVCGMVFGIPLGILINSSRELMTPGTIFLTVLLGLSLLVVAVGNIVAVIVACVRAHSGKQWVIPWLRWIVGEPPVQTGGVSQQK